MQCTFNTISQYKDNEVEMQYNFKYQYLKYKDNAVEMQLICSRKAVYIFFVTVEKRRKVFAVDFK
jgi:hypothetical protein